MDAFGDPLAAPAGAFPDLVRAFAAFAAPALRAGNALGRRLTVRGPSHLLDPETLLIEAAADPDRALVEEDLALLARHLRANDRLTVLGRWVAHADLRNLLANRIAIARALARRPWVRETPVRRPIFITGLPRSGSTLLHRLLTVDHRHRAPTTWEIMHPVPGPGPAQRDVRRRIRKSARQLQWFAGLARGIRAAHPLSALAPEECIAITAHTFRSPRFHTTYWIPEYERWLRGADALPAYRFHSDFLRYLQANRQPRRWVLKAPAHLENLEALFRVYPDALVVRTHRDPVIALGSVASLTEILQSAFQRPPPRTLIGEQVLERWSHVVATGVLRSHSGADRQFIDVHYHRLLRAPMTVVRSIYERLGQPLTEAVQHRMQRYLAENRQYKHGRHRYSARAYGLTPERIREAFRDYYAFLERLPDA